MGYVSLLGPDGRVRAKSTFGADTGSLKIPEIANDGFLTGVEIFEAQQRLEELINRQDCGYGGPLGLGGWGGINELCLQPWNLGGPAREKTPDGYAMKVKLQIVEEYREPTGYIFHSVQSTPPKEVEVTMRWENGKIRLYQCEPPTYFPPAPPAPTPTPDLMAELQKAGNFLWSGVNRAMQATPIYTASIVNGMSSFIDVALPYFNSAFSSDEDKVAGNP